MFTIFLAKALPVRQDRYVLIKDYKKQNPDDEYCNICKGHHKVGDCPLE